METRTPKDKCPKCGKTFDATTGAYDNNIVPRKGDVTVCIKCGEILVFKEDMRTRLPTEKEIRIFSLDKNVMQLQLVVRGIRR
jgi:hypothetical protein